MTIKRLGVLTSGGDCPGLNAAIRAVVSHAKLTHGWEVLGIPYGTQGLAEGRPAIELSAHGLDLRGIDPLLSMGGTILGSINKGDTAAHTDQILAGYEALKLDALVAIGGDGSLKILSDLAKLGGWKLVGVPKTIDNDVPFTEYSIGFDTAVNTVVDAFQKLSYTAASHDRVMILETMGREAGHLALHAGIAGGADVILIPEVPYTIEGVCGKINELRHEWKQKFCLVVVAEGARTVCGEACEYKDNQGHTRLRGIGDYIAEQISQSMSREIEARVTVLGHVQRGGMPSAFDRILASALGKAAVDLLANDLSDHVVVWRNGKVDAVSIADLCAHSPRLVAPDSCLIQTARSIGTYIGEFS